MKSYWKILFTAIVGFMLGAMLFHSNSVHATGTPRITAVEDADGSPRLSRIEGAVVGISCVRNWSGPGSICYVLSQ
jgi:hypothetical protein